MEQLGREYKTNGQPFFLRCEFWGPHMPCYAPEPYYSMYHPDRLNLPDNFWKLGTNKPEVHSIFRGFFGIGTHPMEIQKKYIASYLAYASSTDAQIGRILAALEQNGLTEDTLVIFTSDHGDMLGAHCLYDKGPFMYDEIYRVPLIVRWPGRVRPGRNAAALVYNMDLAATVRDLLNVPSPSVGSARSLLPILTGKTNSLDREFIISEFWHHFGFYPQSMIHSGRDKFIFNFGGTDEYYDHATDPGELDNRIRDPKLRERILHMREHLMKWQKNVNSPMRGHLNATLPAKDY